MRWYERSMPKVGDAISPARQAAQDLSETESVDAVYAWGSLAQNYKNKGYRIKDIDLLIKVSLDSGDLLAIDTGPYSPLDMPRMSLEEEGFNPDAVAFTKKVLKLSSCNFDPWVLSEDQKILHWGFITDTVDEWSELRQIAENATEKQTGLSRKTLFKATQKNLKKWEEIFDQEMNFIIDEQPLGWYQSREPFNKDTTMKDTIRLDNGR